MGEVIASISVPMNDLHLFDDRALGGLAGISYGAYFLCACRMWGKRLERILEIRGRGLNDGAQVAHLRRRKRASQHP